MRQKTRAIERLKRMNMRETVFIILRIVICISLLILLSTELTALAQSSDRQTQPATQAQSADDADLINADRPGIADGSSVIGHGRIQIESGIQAEYRRDADTRDHTLFVPTLFRIGFNNKWEARIEGNTFTRDRTFDSVTSDTATGFAPLSFGFKYHFQDSNGLRHPSLGTIFRLFPAWGSKDFRTHHATGDLRLVADWDFARKLSLNPNVGIARYEDNQERTFIAGLYAVTLNYLPTKKLNPFVDMGSVAPEESQGRSSIILDTGVAYIVGHNVQLDASVGKGVHGLTPPHPFISAGISFRARAFGQKR
jgi:hypothetical protein